MHTNQTLNPECRTTNTMLSSAMHLAPLVLIRVAWCPLVVSSRFASWTLGFGFRASDLGFVLFGALTSVPLGVLRGRTKPSVEVTRFGCGCAALGPSVSIGG